MKMRMIRLAVVFLTVIVTLFIAVQNRHAYVTVSLFFGEPVAMPLYQPLLAALGLGVLAAALVLAPPMIRCRLELRRQTRILRSAQADLERQRRMMERQHPVRRSCDTENLYDE